MSNYTDEELNQAAEAWNWAADNLVPQDVKDKGDDAVKGWVLCHTIDTTIDQAVGLAKAGLLG